jgi:preprotein translocase subunit SecG
MILFLLTAVIMTLLVLIQRGRGGGLAGAFGGAGGSSAFGTKTADVFVRATAVVGAIFFILSIVTAMLLRPPREIPRAPAAAPAPAEPGGGETPAEKPSAPPAETPAGASSGGAATQAPATTPAPTPPK